MEEFLKLLYTYKLGIFVFTLFINAIVGLVVLIMKSKKTGIRILFGVAVIIIAFAVLAFSVSAMNSKYSFSDPRNGIWEALDFSISLLGLLLTAGAAFATVAAIISYISVNDKLKSAKEELTKIEDLLGEQERLSRNIEDLKGYESASAELNRNTDNQKQIEAAKKIANMDRVPFYDKLKANAILNDDKANNYRDEKEWKKAYYLYQESANYWQLIYLNDNREDSLKNYTISLLNMGYTFARIESRAYDELIKLYSKIIEIYENNRSLERSKAVFNNLGNKQRDKAEAIHDKNETLSLLKDAIVNFKKAIILDKNVLLIYVNTIATINVGIRKFKGEQSLLKGFLDHSKKEFDKIKHLERNEECEKVFNEIEQLLNEKLEGLNSN